MKAPRVLFFDVNETLLDLTRLRNALRGILDGRKELVSQWFGSLLHYSLVNTVSGKYTSFQNIGMATLEMTAARNQIPLDPERAKSALQLMRQAPPHLDVALALNELQDAGYPLYALTNSSQQQVDEQLEQSDLSQFFVGRLSVDEVGKFKPHPEVYHWACQQAEVAPEHAMLIAAHAWDTSGAIWAGLRAVFIARPGQIAYPLGPSAEKTVDDFSALSAYLRSLSTQSSVT